MERSRDGYRGRYRDRHENGSTNRPHHQDRVIRGNYRGHLSYDHDNNGHQTFRSSSPRSLPPPLNSTIYHYRSSRTSYNSRPVSSRNASSRHYRHHENDDYPPSVNRNSNQSSYYDNRSSSHRELYPPTLLDEQTIPSNNPFLANTSYYSSSVSSSSSPPPVGFPRDRNLPLSPQGYIESDRNRYIPVSNRRESPSPPPPVSSYRNERSMEYTSRNPNTDIYMRNEYRPPSPSSLASVSLRVDPYADLYRGNDYGVRSDRYDIPSNRTNPPSRDYSNHRHDIYRSSSSSSSNAYMISREEYSPDASYRHRRSSSREYDTSSSSRSNYSSYHERSNLKRPSSRYDNDDDHGSIPSKRPMRR